MTNPNDTKLPKITAETLKSNILPEDIAAFIENVKLPSNVKNFGQAIRLVENKLVPELAEERKKEKIFRKSQSYSGNARREHQVNNRDHSGLINIMEERRRVDKKSLDEFYKTNSSNNNNS